MAHDGRSSAPCRSMTDRPTVDCVASWHTASALTGHRRQHRSAWASAAWSRALSMSSRAFASPRRTFASHRHRIGLLPRHPILVCTTIVATNVAAHTSHASLTLGPIPPVSPPIAASRRAIGTYPSPPPLSQFYFYPLPRDPFVPFPYEWVPSRRGIRPSFFATRLDRLCPFTCVPVPNSAPDAQFCIA